MICQKQFKSQDPRLGFLFEKFYSIYKLRELDVSRKFKKFETLVTGGTIAVLEFLVCWVILLDIAFFDTSSLRRMK